MKKYGVSIIHSALKNMDSLKLCEFEVEANNEKEAIEKFKSMNLKILNGDISHMVIVAGEIK
jgi:phosphoribosylformylglycinamidine (FGAM) synthase PurS component